MRINYASNFSKFRGTENCTSRNKMRLNVIYFVINFLHSSPDEGNVIKAFVKWIIMSIQLFQVYLLSFTSPEAIGQLRSSRSFVASDVARNSDTQGGS